MRNIKIYQIPIHLLRVEKRIHNVLKRQGLQTIGDLVDILEKNGLKDIPNIGPTQMGKIRRALLEGGYFEENSQVVDNKYIGELKTLETLFSKIINKAKDDHALVFSTQMDANKASEICRKMEKFLSEIAYKYADKEVVEELMEAVQEFLYS